MFVSSPPDRLPQWSLQGPKALWSFEAGKPNKHQLKVYLMLTATMPLTALPVASTKIDAFQDYVQSAHPTSVCPVSWSKVSL